MSNREEIVELKWRGSFSVSQFLADENRTNASVEGVYLIIENAASKDAKPAWYFGQTQNIFTRIKDHISGLMFFQYWYFPRDARSRENWKKSLWNSLPDFSQNLDEYEQQVRDQLPERREALEAIRFFWAPTPPGLRKGVEAELIAWLYDSAPDSIINAQGKREPRIGLSNSHNFDQIDRNGLLTPLEDQNL